MKITSNYRGNIKTHFTGYSSYKKNGDYVILEETRRKDGSKAFYEVELHKTEVCRMIKQTYLRNMPKLLYRIMLWAINRYN